MKILLNKGKEFIKKNIPHSVRIGTAAVLCGTMTMQSCNEDYSFQGTEQQKKELINKARNLKEDKKTKIFSYENGIVKIITNNGPTENKRVLYKEGVSWSNTYSEETEIQEVATAERIITINTRGNIIEGTETHQRSDGSIEIKKLDDDLIKYIIETAHGDNDKLYDGGAGDEAY